MVRVLNTPSLAWAVVAALIVIMLLDMGLVFYGQNVVHMRAVTVDQQETFKTAGLPKKIADHHVPRGSYQRRKLWRWRFYRLRHSFSTSTRRQVVSANY